MDKILKYLANTSYVPEKQAEACVSSQGKAAEN